MVILHLYGGGISEQAEVIETLSKREMEVAAAYADGASYKEIARDLGISPTTVRSHLRAVYSKLGVTSKIALAQMLADPGEVAAPVDEEGLTADLALELDDAMRRERMMAHVLRIISQKDANLDDVLDQVLDHALDICEAEFGILMAHQGEYAFTEMRSRNISKAFHDWLLEQGLFNPGPDTAVGRSARSLTPVSVADVGGEGISWDENPLRMATIEYGRARSLAAIPMTAGGRLIGVFSVYRTRVHPFNDRALELAQAFADQAAIAIENARQFATMEARLEQATATREILEAISSASDDETPVFDAILGNARKLCDAPFAALILGRESDGYQTMIAHHGAVQSTEDIYSEGRVPMDPEKSFAARAIIERRPVHLPNMMDTDQYRAGVPNVVELCDLQGIRTNLFVPLIKDGAGIGCFIIFRHEVRPYSEDQIALVETFAAQAVIALENVRQFQELQKQLDRDAATREILQAISHSRDDEAPVFDAILKNAARICGSPMARLELADRSQNTFHCAAAWGEEMRSFQIGEAMPLDRPNDLPTAIREGVVRHIHDLSKTDLYLSGEPTRVRMVEEEGYRTYLVVPLLAQDVGVGAIVLSRREVAPFPETDIALLESFARQAVIAIENVRQFRSLRDQLDREATTREILGLLSRVREDEQPVFEAILDNATRLCGAPNASLILGRAGDTSQVMVASRGATTDETRELYNSGAVPMDPADSLVAQAIVEQRTIHVPDMKDTDGYRMGHERYRILVEHQGIRTNLFVPLTSPDGGVGCFILWKPEVSPFTPDQIALVEIFAAQAAIALENAQQFKALQARTAEVQSLNASLEAKVDEQVGEIARMGQLKQFMSPAVADALVSSGDEKALSSHRALIATLFCDIRGFTAFCETAEPEETIEVLQDYHEQMGELISAHGGGVDKRMGDGIMVIFNDPLPCDDPAGDAVRLALAMHAAMKTLCAKWKKLGHRLGFGVGVSLGYATVGMVGSEGRFDYTASGTSVNTAARLSDLAADGETLLSPRAWAAVEGEVQAESRGEISIKGIREPVEVFAVVD